MTVEVEIDGRRLDVELDQTSGGWVAMINGRRVMVDAARTPWGWSLLLNPQRPTSNAGPTPNWELEPQHGWELGVSRESTSYEVSVEDRGLNEVIVHVNGRAVAVHLVDPRKYVRRGRGDATSGQSGLRQVKAPMPGRVIKVLVNPGDRVTARQPLIVVEAMKMENELRSPAEAVVRDVRVIEGASVEAGTILLVLE